MIQAAEIFVPISSISPPTNPSRATIDPERVAALADDIAANGLLQRIGVAGPDAHGRYALIYGHRRYLALALLHWAEAPVKCWPPDTDPAELRASENNIREPLTPLEEAAEIDRFMSKGLPLAAVARLYRRSTTWVNERRELLTLPADLRTALGDGTLNLSVARVLGDIDHQEYRESLIAEAARTGATAAVANIWRAHYLADKPRIIENRMMVEQITERRAAWKIVVPCDLCADDHEYPDTRSLRVCQPCLDAVRDLMEQAAAEATTQTEPEPSTPLH